MKLPTKWFGRYARNAGWLFLEYGLHLLLGLTVSVIVARYLGPSNFGVISFIGAVMLIAGAVARLGMESILIRELVKRPFCHKELLVSAFYIQALSAVSIVLVVWGAALIWGKDTITGVGLAITAVALLFRVADVFDWWFQARVQARHGVRIRSAIKVITSLLSLALVWLGAPLLAFLTLGPLGALLTATGLIWAFRREGGEMHLNAFDRRVAATLIRDSWPLVLVAVAVSINMRVDQVMLKAFLGDESVGIYAVAVALSTPLAALPHLATKAVFPRFVVSEQTATAAFEKQLVLGYRLLGAGGLVMFVGALLFSTPVITLLYGKEFVTAAGVFNIYILVVLFSGIAAMNSIYLRVANLQKKSATRQWINVGSNIVLNTVLIPAVGLAGAALATVWAVFFSSVVYDLFDKECARLNALKLRAFFPFLPLHTEELAHVERGGEVQQNDGD